jgi:hypothetical protein
LHLCQDREWAGAAPLAAAASVAPRAVRNLLSQKNR